MSTLHHESILEDCLCEAEFAENFLNDCYGMPDMPYWVAIDWEKTWDDGLSWDYTFSSGYVFSNNW